jgi:hypothetical protein
MKSLVFSIVLLCTSFSFSAGLDLNSFLGVFEGSDGASTHFTIEIDKKGQMTFSSPVFGVCGTNNRESYEYNLSIDDEPLVLNNASAVVSLSGTVFCKNSWLQLKLEMVLNPPLQGEAIRAAILLQDSSLRDVLDRQLTLRKIK